MKKGDVVGHVDPESLKPLPLPEPTANWYLFSVFAGSEEKLASKIGETAYYPRRFVWQKLRRRLQSGVAVRVKKFFPVLSGYLFYNGELGHPGIEWMRNDRRVIGLRSVNGVPSPIRNEEIHRMRMAELAGSAEVTEVFSVIVGEVIEITIGPFAGKIGVVREMEFGKTLVEFPLNRQFAKFSVSELGKISFKP